MNYLDKQLTLRRSI